MASTNPADRLPGPGPGRPKGSKNKPPSVRKLTKKLVQDQFDSLVKMSKSILEEDLQAVKEDPVTGEPLKDSRGRPIPDKQKRSETARFLLGRLAPVAPKPRTYIEGKLLTKLEQFTDIQEISKEAIILLMDGDMSFEQVAELQSIIQTHAGIEGYMKVEDLRIELERIANARLVNGSKTIPLMSQVTWGTGATHDGNSPDTPAE